MLKDWQDQTIAFEFEPSVGGFLHHAGSPIILMQQLEQRSSQLAGDPLER